MIVSSGPADLIIDYPSDSTVNVTIVTVQPEASCIAILVGRYAYWYGSLLGMVNPQLSRDVYVVARFIPSASIPRSLTRRDNIW